MKSRFGSLWLGALICLVPSLQAANNFSLNAPALGYVFDQETGEFRRMDGFLGSSSLSSPIELGFTVTQAFVALGREFAIVQDEQGAMLLVNLSATPPSAVALDGAMAGADGVMFSPSGQFAALYAKQSGRVQLVQGLDGVPQLGEELTGLAGLGNWAAFALSDSGVVLAASSDSDVGSVYVLRPGETPRRVASIQRPGGLAFFSGSDDAVVADAGAHEVLVLRNSGGWWHPTPVATVNDGINNPFLVNVTKDGRYVVVATPGGVTSIPLNGGVPVFTDCACSPAALDSLAGGNVFLLTADIHSPLQVVEVGDQSRVRFVPALPSIEAVSK